MPRTLDEPGQERLMNVDGGDTAARTEAGQLDRLHPGTAADIQDLRPGGQA